jgi:hypothetical protein
MNDEQYFLANAYLDGEITDEERRIAESDPDVMSEVERLRALQADLRAVEPPTVGAREAAISAALAEFGRSSATEPAAATAAAIPFRPRPVYARYLAIAAAVVAVAGLGIVISQAGFGGGGDDSASVADEPVAATAREGEPTASIEGTADAAGGAVAADGGQAESELAPDESADMVVASEADEAGDTAIEATAESTSDVSYGEAQSPSNPGRIAVPPGFDPDQPITREFELAVYGSYLLDQRDLGLLGATPNTPCGGDYEILARARLELDETRQTVYVAVRELDGSVLAVDTTTCGVIVTASLSGN